MDTALSSAASADARALVGSGVLVGRSTRTAPRWARSCRAPPRTEQD